MASLKLLVVEDDPAGLELITEVFASLQAQVRPIADSQKAAVVINQEKFDGIFLDLEMPNLHGLALAQKIRESSWNKLTRLLS
jgi:CheY-like chemotaxis protein